ncbi:GNAT family N-acetyltransferase [bacterium]|nr:GNAT family N-acetyltransferase [bacterium]
MRRKKNNGRYTLRLVSYAAHEAEIRTVRHAVFVKEQGVPDSIERDGRDSSCIHVLAFDPEGRAVGTGRMTEDGHVGRMAVLKAHRRKGVGRAMLDALVERAREKGMDSVCLNAQLYAVPFYTKAGFAQKSAVFFEASMPHVSMEKMLRHPR